MEAPLRIGFLGAGLIATYHSRMLGRSGADPSTSPAAQVPTGEAPTGQTPTGQASNGRAPGRASTNAPGGASTNAPASGGPGAAMAGAVLAGGAIQPAAPAFERVGVYDPDRERAARFAERAGCDALDSEEAVLDRCDAVYVCSWTSEHPRLVAAAAERGVHVFCEKPLAVDLATAESMLATVEAAGITHQVGLVLRRSPAFVMLRELVHDPDAGRVMAVVFRDDQYIPVQGQYSSTWRADRHRAGSGTLLEHSIHDVDLLRSIVGDITTVNAHQRNLHGHDGIEDTVSATVCFEGGPIGSLTSVWHDNLARPSLRRVEVLCERRHVVMEGDDWDGPITWTDADGSTTTLHGAGLMAEAAPILAAEPLVVGHGRSANPDLDFIAAAARGAPAWPDLSVAVEAHRIVDAMYRSAGADGATVPIRPVPA